MVPKISHEDLSPRARAYQIEGMQISALPGCVTVLLPLKHKGWEKLDRMGEPAKLLVPAIWQVYGLAPTIWVETNRLIVKLDSRRVDIEREAEEVYAEVQELMELCFQDELAWQAYWEKKCREAYEAGLGCGKCVRGWIRFRLVERGTQSSNRAPCGNPGCQRDDLYYERWRQQRRDKNLPLMGWGEWWGY